MSGVLVALAVVALLAMWAAVAIVRTFLAVTLWVLRLR
jgi:hypothetical protein